MRHSGTNPFCALSRPCRAAAVGATWRPQAQPRCACTRPVHRRLWPAGSCRWPANRRRQQHPGGCRHCRVRVVGGGRGQRLANRGNVVSDKRTHQTVAPHHVMAVGKDVALRRVEFSASFRRPTGARTDVGIDDTHAATRRSVQQVRLRRARFWGTGSPLPSSHVKGRCPHEDLEHPVCRRQHGLARHFE